MFLKIRRKVIRRVFPLKTFSKKTLSFSFNSLIFTKIKHLPFSKKNFVRNGESKQKNIHFIINIIVNFI